MQRTFHSDQLRIPHIPEGLSSIDPVLVTGATGHLGNNLIRALIRQGRPVRALVRHKSTLLGLGAPDLIHAKETGQLKLITGDILDSASLKRALEGVRSVFHAAAVFSYRNADKEEIMQTGLKGARNLLECVASEIERTPERPIERVIFTSSVAAVGMSSDKQHVLNELHFNTDERDPHISSSTASELLAKEVGARYGLPIVFCNPSILLGPHDYRITPSTGVVLRFLNELYPFYYEGGLNLVDVEDVAIGHLLAEAKGRIGERYILSGDNVTILEMMTTLQELTGLPAPKIKLNRFMFGAVVTGVEKGASLLKKSPPITRDFVDYLAGRYAWFDHQKATDELGWYPRSYRNVLRRSVRWLISMDFIKPRRLKKIELSF